MFPCDVIPGFREQRVGLDLRVIGFDCIEPGIRPLVEALFRKSFHGLRCSCEGHLKTDPGPKIPFVSVRFIWGNEHSARKMMELTDAVARYNTRQGKLLAPSQTWVLDPQKLNFSGLQPEMADDPSTLHVYLRPTCALKGSASGLKRLHRQVTKLAEFIERFCRND